MVVEQRSLVFTSHFHVFFLIRVSGALELFLLLIDGIHESAENNGLWLFTIDVPAARAQSKPGA